MSRPFAAILLLLLPAIAAADADDPKFQDAPVLEPARVEGDVRFLHPDGVSDGSFSRDGKYLVTLSRTSDSTIRMWELTTGKLVQRFEASSYGGSQRPVLSPNSTKLYSGHHEVRIWDVKAGKIDARIRAQMWTLSHDGKTLVTLNTRYLPNDGKSERGGDKLRTDGFDVKTFDATGKAIRTLLKLQGAPCGLALSRDGKTLAVCSAGSEYRGITLIDPTAKFPEGKGVSVPRGTGDHFALSADGRYLAVSSPFEANPQGAKEAPSIMVIDLKNGQNLAHHLREPKSEIHSLEFLADGRLLSTEKDAAFIVWSLGEDVTYVKHYRGDLLYNFGASVTADAKKALVFPTNRADRRAHVVAPLMLDLATGKVRSLARPSKLAPLFPEPKKVEWEGDRVNLGNMYLRLPDGRWLHHLNHLKQQMWLLDKAKSTKLHEFDCPSHKVHVSADGGRLYQVRPDKSDRFPATFYLRGDRYSGVASCLRVWNLKTSKETAAIGGNVPCGDFWVSPDEKSVAIAHADGVVRVWDIPTGRVRHRLAFPPFATYFGGKTYFSPDGRSLVREAEGVRVTWDVREKAKEVSKGQGK